MKADDSLVLMKCFFNEGLVMFDKDKEMEVYQTKQLMVKTPERKLQLV